MDSETDDGWLMVDAPRAPPANSPEEKWVLTAIEKSGRDKYLSPPGIETTEKENADGDETQNDDCASALCGSEASHASKSTNSEGKLKTRAKKAIVTKKNKDKHKRKKKLAPFSGASTRTRELYP